MLVPVITVAAVTVLIAAVAVLNQVIRLPFPGSVVTTPAIATTRVTATSSDSASDVDPTMEPPISPPTAPAVKSLPAGSWITILDSLPKNEFSQVQAEAKAVMLSVAGYPVSVIDSDAIPSLNGGYWALGVTGSSSREAAVGLCGVLGRQAGGSCYPRQVG